MNRNINRTVSYIMIFLMAFFISMGNECSELKASTNLTTYEIGNWKGFANGCVSYTFDDEYDTHFTTVKEMFDEYDYKATFYLITSLMNEQKWTMAKEMAENGHEMGSHTVTHNYLNDWNCDVELGNSKQEIENRIGKKCLTVAYPYCVMPTQSYVEKYYLSGRACSGDIERSTPYNYMNLGSIICGTQGSAKDGDAMISMIQKASKNNGWAVFLIHDLTPSGYSPITPSDLKASLQYIKENQEEYWVATVADATKYSEERDCASVSVSQEETNMRINVTDTLDNDIYDSELSIRIPNTNSWEEVRATQGEREIDSYIKDGYIYIDVVPNSGEITIQNVTNTTNTKVELSIVGYQIGTVTEGFRTIYKAYDPDKEIENVGLIYGMEGYSELDEMVIDGNGAYSFEATNQGIIIDGKYYDKSAEENVDLTLYTMTMKFAAKTEKYFTAKHYVRVYAKLKDGTYIYSDIEDVSIYDLSDNLYQNMTMSNARSHSYLYNNILLTVNPNYRIKEFDYRNMLVK